MNSTNSHALAERTATQVPNNHNGSNQAVAPLPIRRRLPDERASRTHRFNIAGHDVYLTVGMFPDGGIGELFIVTAKEGSTVSGLVNSFAQVVSIALQYGVPLSVLCDKFTGIRFEPSGFTGNQEIPLATSIMDYIFRWLRLRFLGKSNAPSSNALVGSTVGMTLPTHDFETVEVCDGPACKICGSLTRRNGSCFACTNCGATTGCG
jgi:ribonucleoside-diphosphate reductase alpha chain